jgi:hypothetical protein
MDPIRQENCFGSGLPHPERANGQANHQLFVLDVLNLFANVLSLISQFEQAFAHAGAGSFVTVAVEFLEIFFQRFQ